jgi:two-component system, OmpR family, sensor histidine kinase RstB
VLRFYLRVVLAIVLATLATVALESLVLESPEDAVILRMLGGHAALHADAIARTPAIDRRAKVDDLARSLGYGVQMEAAVGSPEPRAEWRAGRVHIVAGVPGTPGQLTFGPTPYAHVASVPALVAVSALLAAFAAWFALRPLMLRVRSLENAAAQIRAGNFATRVHNAPGDPLDNIGASLNQLADRIGQLLSDERDLLRTVAHEVRAPISRMRFRVEKIHDKAEAFLKKDSAGLISDLQQVDKLFEELLTYVAFDEFDYERPKLQTTTIEVTAAVSRIVAEVTATEESALVEVKGAPDAQIIANLKLFDRAVTNLLLNALAYGGPRVTIFVREFTDECVVDVQDSGPGIPELDRPKVIKPFVRLSKKKTRGTGLGLAIVSRIMKLHSGRLHILNAPSGGASIQLVWKNARSRPRRRWSIGGARSALEAAWYGADHR